MLALTSQFPFCSNMSLLGNANLCKGPQQAQVFVPSAAPGPGQMQARSVFSAPSFMTQQPIALLPGANGNFLGFPPSMTVRKNTSQSQPQIASAQPQSFIQRVQPLPLPMGTGLQPKTEPQPQTQGQSIPQLIQPTTVTPTAPTQSQQNNSKIWTQMQFGAPPAHVQPRAPPVLPQAHTQQHVPIVIKAETPMVTNVKFGKCMRQCSYVHACLFHGRFHDFTWSVDVSAWNFYTHTNTKRAHPTIYASNNVLPGVQPSNMRPQSVMHATVPSNAQPHPQMQGGQISGQRMQFAAPVGMVGTTPQRLGAAVDMGMRMGLPPAQPSSLFQTPNMGVCTNQKRFVRAFNQASAPAHIRTTSTQVTNQQPTLPLPLPLPMSLPIPMPTMAMPMNALAMHQPHHHQQQMTPTKLQTQTQTQTQTLSTQAHNITTITPTTNRSNGSSTDKIKKIDAPYISIVTNGRERFGCTVCSKSYSSYYVYRRHYGTHFGVVCMYVCMYVRVFCFFCFFLFFLCVWVCGCVFVWNIPYT